MDETWIMFNNPIKSVWSKKGSKTSMECVDKRFNGPKVMFIAFISNEGIIHHEFFVREKLGRNRYSTYDSDKFI